MVATPYSRHYLPPAPVLSVQLSLPDGAPRNNKHIALVDTGADSTMVPLTLLEDMSAPISHMATVRAHIGDRVYLAAVHQVDLIVNDAIRLPGIDVVSDDWGDEIILGRNVLNKLRLFLNGPDQFTNMVD